MSVKPKFLRPSILPKLALCGGYRSEEFAGNAAERGTRMDAVFRDVLSGKNSSPTILEEGEGSPVMWAIKTARLYAAGEFIETREEFLKVEIDIEAMTGTADALCEALNWSADLKSGQMRDYEAQQACYALGFMDRFFVDEWTVYLFYCDQEQVQTLRFTRESAEECIHDALALYLGGVPPQLNDYCGWCAARFTCPVRKESLGIIPFDETGFDISKASSEQLRNFCLRAGVVSDFEELARATLKERVFKGEKVAGVSLSTRRGSRAIEAIELSSLVPHIPAAQILAVCKNISEDIAKNLWGEATLAAAGVFDDFPSDKVIEGGGSTSIRISLPKAAK